MSEPTRAPRKRRLFFALWPSDELRQRIALDHEALIRDSRGRPTASRNLHITVLFVGEVEEPQVSLVVDSGAAITAPRFQLALDSIDTLSPSKVLCLESSREPPSALLELAERLRFSLLDKGIKLKQQVMRPHLTLARQLPRPMHRRAPASYTWDVVEFVLVESTLAASGSEYEIIGRWPLAASGQ